MELILLTNLAFSVVGFVFIFRMWKEVKSRRDYYGENFGIPRGEGVPMDVQTPTQATVNGLTNEQLAFIVSQVSKQEQQKEEEKARKQQELIESYPGDLGKLIGAAMAAQEGGADELR